MNVSNRFPDSVGVAFALSVALALSAALSVGRAESVREGAKVGAVAKTGVLVLYSAMMDSIATHSSSSPGHPSEVLLLILFFWSVHRRPHVGGDWFGVWGGGRGEGEGREDEAEKPRNYHRSDRRPQVDYEWWSGCCVLVSERMCVTFGRAGGKRLKIEVRDAQPTVYSRFLETRK